jgi:hypothetical protein
MTNVNTNSDQKENKSRVPLEKIAITPVKASNPIIEKTTENLYDTYKAKSLKDTITESAKAKYSFQEPSNFSSKPVNT